MIIEEIFRYIGMILCITASIYLYISGSKKIASLLLLSFALQFQMILYMQFADHPHPASQCMATVQEYYACLPLSFKISTHSAQLSFYIMALAIFMLAKENKNEEPGCT